MPKGILKNLVGGSPDRLRSTSSQNSSAENSISSSNASNVGLLSKVASSVTLHNLPEEHNKKAEGDMVDIPLHGEEGDHSHTLPKQTAVRFPMEPELRLHGLPYPYVRQDSDALSTRASSIAATDDEDSEDYDWSDEDDLVDEQAKFGKKMGKRTKPEGWGPRRIIAFMFSSLIGSTLFAGILITPAILIHFYWYKPHPSDYRRYVKDNIQSWLFWAAANLVISWYLAMIIDIIPVLAHYFVVAAWGHVSESMKTRMETYDSVKNTAKPAFYAASAYASWIIIFSNIFDLYNDSNPHESRAGYTFRLEQVVQFFFFATLVWCIQGMLSHFIAFSFHRTAYKERIESVEKTLVVIEKLRQYRPKHITTPHKSGARTPVFGSLGFPSTTLTDSRQHSQMLSGALKKAASTPPRSHIDLGHEDSDAEDMDKTLIDSGKKSKHGKGWNRLSFFGGSDDQHEFSAVGHDVNSDSSPNSQDNEKMVGKGGLEAEIEMSPVNPSTGQVYTSTSAPAMHSTLSPYRYPPNHGSPRESVDAVDSTLKNAAKVLKTAVLHDARNMRRKTEEKDGLSWNVNSSHEAKRLAKSIYMRFKDRRRTWLIPADFYPAFPDEESAKEAFKVFDSDNNGDLSRAELKTVLLKVYRERRFLSRSMRDVGEALRTLDRILLFFAGVVLFFISLSVFGVQVGDSLTSIYTLGIAMSFIFKNAASNAFDAIMLLFVTHPYDTGDRVFIGGENLVVKRVGLFATVFARSDGTETYLFNSQLFTQFIQNVRRSGKTFENLTMQVAWRIPLTKLDALEKCLNEWLSTEENRWFEPSTNITLQHIRFQRYLELTIGIGHNGNWQDWGLRNARKTAFHAAVQYYCRQLGITGYEAPQPIVWANPETMTYQPSTPLPEDIMSPTDGLDSDRLEQIRREEETEAKNVKPTLGFLPPLADRHSNLLRTRKSRNRRANAGAANGE